MNEAPLQFSPGQKAALILVGNLGDLLLLEPCLRMLHARGLVLDLFCTQETAMVWRGNPVLRRVVPIRASNVKYSAAGEQTPEPLRWRGERYDYSFDFWPTGRSTKLTLRLMARQRCSWVGRPGKRLLHWLVYNRRVPFPGLDIRRDRVYLAQLGLRDAAADPWLPARLAVPEAEVAAWRAGQRFLAPDPAQPLLIVQPTARWRRKLWPVAHWRRLIEALPALTRARPVLVSGPAADEMAMLREIAAGLVPDEALFPGTLAWPDLRRAFAAAEGFIGLDSAPYHLAAMLGKPLVVLFGGTNEKEWGPVLPRQHVVKAPLVEGQHAMASLPVEAVLDACRAVLQTP